MTLCCYVTFYQESDEENCHFALFSNGKYENTLQHSDELFLQNILKVQFGSADVLWTKCFSLAAVIKLMTTGKVGFSFLSLTAV